MQADLSKLFAQAQKMQADMDKQRGEISALKFEGTAGGGLANVVVNGDMEVESISILPAAVDPEDVEMLEDVILAAIKDAQKRVVAERKSRLPSFGGVDFSDLF